MATPKIKKRNPIISNFVNNVPKGFTIDPNNIIIKKEDDSTSDPILESMNNTKMIADDKRKIFNKMFDENSKIINARMKNDYKIPFIKDKAIRLKNGNYNNVLISTNELDSIAKYADKVGLPIKTAFGLVGQETTLGRAYASEHGKYGKLSKKEQTDLANEGFTDSPMDYNRSMSQYINAHSYYKNNPYFSIIDKVSKESNYFPEYTKDFINRISDRELIDNFKYINNNELQYASNKSKNLNLEDNPYMYSFKSYKEHPEKWNSGLSTQQSRVDKQGDILMNDPAIKKWYNDSEYNPNNKTTDMSIDSRPKRFLGAALGVAQLGMSIYSMIQNNKMQKQQVAEQNRINTRNENLQMNQRLDTEAISERNYGSNQPINNFYANGGRRPVNSRLQPVSSDATIAIGATHNQRNNIDGGTGVPYKGIEVEGGGANQTGEVIKHEGSGDFIFSDRIPYGNAGTFADVAKNITLKKGDIEKNIAYLIKGVDSNRNKIATSGSMLQASTDIRKSEIAKSKISKLVQEKDKLDATLEQLKQQQLQVGMQMGLYNSDGTPKDTQNVPADNQMVQAQQPTEQTNEQQMAYGGRPKYTPGGWERFNNKLDNFMASPEGYGVMGLANTAVNFISNMNTADNLSKLKLPSYVPVKNVDTQKVNLSADRQSIKEGIQSISNFADNNFSNPQVGLSVRQNAISKGIQESSRINQQEDVTNRQIEDSNISRRLNIDMANNKGIQEQGMLEYQKSSSDINNRQAITAGLVKDLQSTIQGYQQGKQDDEKLDLYSRTYAPGVGERTDLVRKYKIDLNVLSNMDDEKVIRDYMYNKGADESEIDEYIKNKSLYKANYLKSLELRKQYNPTIDANGDYTKDKTNRTPIVTSKR